jgi:hypothetical protein
VEAIGADVSYKYVKDLWENTIFQDTNITEMLEIHFCDSAAAERYDWLFTHSVKPEAYHRKDRTIWCQSTLGAHCNEWDGYYILSRYRVIPWAQAILGLIMIHGHNLASTQISDIVHDSLWYFTWDEILDYFRSTTLLRCR